MKRQAFILILIGILSQYAFGQISEGGTPISFSLDIDVGREKIPVTTMPPVDARALLEEDEMLRAENTQIPFRFGYAIDVDIDIKKVGVKKKLPDGGNLWLLKIHCPDAFSINLIYNRFRLAKGSKFFIYNEDRTMILGAFTPEVSNNSYNEFATDLVQGNTIVLEYYESESSNDGVIRISKVIHGYVNTFSDYSSGLGTSANCNIDVMCPLGNNWLNERNAVTMLLVDNNTAFCSGCLVNNTQQNIIPYILTANHCYFDASGTQISNPATNIYRFQYWRPTCSPYLTNPANWKSITGATLRAHYDLTDFTLLELNTRPPVEWGLYYAGWDRTTNPAQSATGIHHPKGDAMKISYEDHPVIAVTYPGCGPVTNHWRVQHFEQGIVQHGSSGSPLFNQNHRIIGQLHGNQNNICGSLISDNPCHCNQIPIGEYGRFDISWDRVGSSSTNRLSNWLDPIGMGYTTLDGMATPIIHGQKNICASYHSAFWVDNAPLGFNWGCSSNLTLYSNTPHESVASFDVTGYGSTGWVSVNLKGIELVRYNVNIVRDVPVVYEIDGPGRVDYYGGSGGYGGIGMGSYEVILSSGSEPFYYEWEVWGPNNYYFKPTFGNEYGYSYYGFSFYNLGWYSVDVKVSNACGEDYGTKGVQVTDGRGSSAYPNPVSDILYIKTDQRANTNQQTITDAKPLKIAKTFDIRLYDGLGNLLRQTTTKGSTVQFNVSNLPDGIYYLHIYDGVRNKPEIQQIMVEH